MMLDRDVALVGLIQNISLMRHIADGKPFNMDLYSNSITQITNTSPKDTLDVYGGAESLSVGLDELPNVLGFKKGYGSSMILVLRFMVLASRILKNKGLINVLGERLDKATHQVNFYPDDLDQQGVILGAVYDELLRPVNHGVVIYGDRAALSKPENITRIRVLLLAATRSAILYLQTGGGLLKFWFHRRRTIKSVNLENKGAN